MSRPICIIPARGGSKRCPGKNARFLVQVITVAQNSGVFDDVYVSSDDESLLMLAYNRGAKTLTRPSRLATDGADLESVMKYYIEDFGMFGPEPAICFVGATAHALTVRHLQQAARMKGIFNEHIVAVSQYWTPIWEVDVCHFYFLNPEMFTYYRDRGIELLHQPLVQYPIPGSVDINTEEDMEEALRKFDMEQIN
jgi:CMP-N-acetylneuraminic acid synthetase